MGAAGSAVRTVTFGLTLEGKETHARGEELSRQEEVQQVATGSEQRREGHKTGS